MLKTPIFSFKETKQIGTVQQLDKNMSNLRTWLSRIEAELAKPVVYSVCHSDEIQRKLEEQQDLQRDIEQHSESVAAVLTLCDVLLHDADACSPDSENDSIQQTTHSLDCRWRNICAMSMERRMRIEETWRLWRKFLDDYSRFEDWLKTAELTAASPGSADVLYTSAKEELKRFEAFQRQVQERHTQLELVNKQYRRLARENRTDSASRLKVMVNDGNQRWDCLQRRVAAILRRLKHFTSQREEFEGSREAILMWLTEMDLQLTNVEHFSESDIEDKMRQLNAFQQEITLNTNKIDALIVFGENLIQKSTPLDAVLIEDELEELHSYCQEVFGRVARFHHRLVHRRPVLDEDKEMSDHDTDLRDPPEISNEPSWSDSRGIQAEEAVLGAEGVSAGQQAMCHLLVPPLDRSGRETPVSVDSIPLEWDHTVDVGGSSSHEEDEDAAFFSALSGKHQVSGTKSVTDPPSWHQPGSPQAKRGTLPVPGPSPTPSSGASFHQQGYVRTHLQKQGKIPPTISFSFICYFDQNGLKSQTLVTCVTPGVIERWELLQAPKFSGETGIKQDLKQWRKLNSKLNDVTSCLSGMLAELNRLQKMAPSTSIQDIEVNVKKLKEMQKTFNSHKCLMISINLSRQQLLRGDSAELQELQKALNSANQSWNRACSGLESWERRLRYTLLECQALRSQLLWLSQAESKLCSVNIRVSCQRRLEMTGNLSWRQQQVSALLQVSSPLLLEASGEDSLEAKERVHVVGSQLHRMTLKVSAALRSLQGKLVGSAPPHPLHLLSPILVSLKRSREETEEELHDSGERKHAPPQPHFLHRVLRAAFHLHLLFFVLLVLICLVPPSEDPSSCKLSNNFARSFQPMLHYTNGPPPT
uniref:Spectrin repeat containing, nuclear envelope 2b n=1 Tax=Oryzias latipes TaxID=8090 RepID=A0A3P9M5D2_ORYLA